MMGMGMDRGIYLCETHGVTHRNRSLFAHARGIVFGVGKSREGVQMDYVGFLMRMLSQKNFQNRYQKYRYIIGT